MNKLFPFALLLFLAISLAGCHAGPKGAPGVPLSSDQTAVLESEFQLLRTQEITADAGLGEHLLKVGMWRAAMPNDVYIAGAEKAGDTPYAYTLSPGYKPLAIVLDARFFNDTTPLGRAAVMIHEMAHYRAYVKTGKSTEYDGYKAEYDLHKKLGLSEADGLVYFSMLDGVAEYVVPREPVYAKFPDIKQYMQN